MASQRSTILRSSLVTLVCVHSACQREVLGQCSLQDWIAGSDAAIAPGSHLHGADRVQRPHQRRGRAVTMCRTGGLASLVKPVPVPLGHIDRQGQPEGQPHIQPRLQLITPVGRRATKITQQFLPGDTGRLR